MIGGPFLQERGAPDQGISCPHSFCPFLPARGKDCVRVGRTKGIPPPSLTFLLFPGRREDGGGAAHDGAAGEGLTGPSPSLSPEEREPPSARHSGWREKGILGPMMADSFLYLPTPHQRWEGYMSGFLFVVHRQTISLWNKKPRDLSYGYLFSFLMGMRKGKRKS